MFSENGKISPRQLRCLLTLDFFGKGALLLPALAEGLTSREFISCLLIVFLLVFAYGRLVERIGRDCGGNFKAYAEQKMGEKTVKYEYEYGLCKRMHYRGLWCVRYEGEPGHFEKLVWPVPARWTDAIKTVQFWKVRMQSSTEWEWAHDR